VSPKILCPIRFAPDAFAMRSNVPILVEYMRCPEAHSRKILQQLVLHLSLSVQVRSRLALIDLLANPACSALATLRSRALSRQRRVTHLDQGNFGSIFFRVVEELAIIPVASWNVVTLDRDCRGPSSAATYTTCQTVHPEAQERKVNSLRRG
jgi:hypothetical protein